MNTVHNNSITLHRNIASLMNLAVLCARMNTVHNNSITLIIEDTLQHSSISIDSNLRDSVCTIGPSCFDPSSRIGSSYKFTHHAVQLLLTQIRVSLEVNS